MHKEEEEERKDIFSLHTPDTQEEEDEKTLFSSLPYEKEDTVTEIENKAFSFWKWKRNTLWRKKVFSLIYLTLRNIVLFLELGIREGGE